jgi:hypothetical protein
MGIALPADLNEVSDASNFGGAGEDGFVCKASGTVHNKREADVIDIGVLA